MRNEIYNLSRFKNHMEEDTLIQTYVTIKLSTGTLFTLSRFRSTHCKNNQVSNCFKSSGNIKRFYTDVCLKKETKSRLGFGLLLHLVNVLSQGSGLTEISSYVAYLLVHCLAILSCSALLVRY